MFCHLRRAISPTLLSLTLSGLSAAVHAQAHLYVTSTSGQKVYQYQGPGGVSPGAFEKQLNTASDPTTLSGPIGIAVGPDGNIYVTDVTTNKIVRYSGATGNFTDVFINGGQLNVPLSATFGPDGNFYVSNRNTNSVLRYKPDGTKFGVGGNTADATFVTTASGNSRELAFDASGNLYVAGFGSGIARYKGTDGSIFGAGGNTSDPAFTSAFSANGITFGSDGTLYATNYFGGLVLKFDSAGTQIGSFNPGSNPLDVKFDDSGALYVDLQSGGVRKYTTSGVDLGAFGDAGTSPIGDSYFMAFSSPGVGGAAATPEPGSLALVLGIGVSGIVLRKRRKPTCR